MIKFYIILNTILSLFIFIFLREHYFVIHLLFQLNISHVEHCLLNDLNLDYFYNFYRVWCFALHYKKAHGPCVLVSVEKGACSSSSRAL
jgi:hypothetical protein